MSIFGSIKNKFRRGGDEDFSDLRSSVLDEPPPMPMQRAEPPPPRFTRPVQEGFGREIDSPASRFDPSDFGTHSPPPFPSRESRFDPRLGEPVEPFPEKKQENYEIIDRLNFIENQLAAIKSQTETINERLKNMELKLGRRY
jgi:hypothetical protein